MTAPIGYGGGKGGSSAQRSPTESPDTLQSTAYARVLDVVSEGEIEGLVGGLEGVYLDGVPIKQGGNYNFKDVVLYDLNGAQDQEYIPGFPSAESEISVGVQVTKAGGGVVRTITDPEVDAAVIAIQIPQLFWVVGSGSAEGSVRPSKVEIAIDRQTNGGGWEALDIGDAKVISGKCTTPYIRTYRVNLPGNGPWDLRVRRITDDDVPDHTNEVWWYSYKQVIDEKLSFPNSAVMALQVAANQFQSIPTRSYRIRGIRVKVPSNYNVEDRTYEGTWNGTFKIAWTDNPAWCLYDLLTSTRYGLGQYIQAANVDKWGLYEIGRYCDGMVPSGAPKRASIFVSPAVSLSVSGTTVSLSRSIGSFIDDGFLAGDAVELDRFGNAVNNGTAIIKEVTATTLTLRATKAFISEPLAARDITLLKPHEPRFTCNLYLQTQEDAYKVINNMASIFRGMAYWASGSVHLTQDSPRDPDFLFTSANVVEGLFNYTSSGKRARHTVAIVSWNDPASRFKIAKEFVTDEEGLSLYGYNPTEVVALGCTSRGQARRVGRWLLHTERLETETVSFQAGIEGAMVNPGSIIRVQDQHRAGERLGGRIVSATTTTLELDSMVEIEAGNTYRIAVVLPDGMVVERNLGMTPGTYKQVTLQSALPQVPVDNAVWIIAVSNLAPVDYRVVAAIEGEDGLHEITALKHNPGKYASIEEGADLPELPTSTIPPSLAPTGLVLDEAHYQTVSGVRFRMSAQWDQNPNATGYVLQWREAEGNWSEEIQLHTHYWERNDIQVGQYIVRVAANINGLRTNFVSASINVIGKTLPPADVNSLVAVDKGFSAELSWEEVPDPDIAVYEVKQGVSVIGLVKGNTFSWKYPNATPSNYTFSVRARDTSGNFSAVPATATLTNVPSYSKQADAIANGAITNKALLTPPTENLIPNGYSEAGAAAAGLDPEGLGLLHSPANAFEGEWCRHRAVDDDFVDLRLSSNEGVTVAPGATIYAEAWIKASASINFAQGTPDVWLSLVWKSASGTIISRTNGAALPEATGTTYVQAQVVGICPAGASRVVLMFECDDHSGNVQGYNFYIDAISMRRAISHDMLMANTIRTSNYKEDGSGNPTHGAKMDNVGTALKVAPDNMQVGIYTLSDTFWRTLNAIDGDDLEDLDGVFWRGNATPGASGMAPDLSRVELWYNSQFSYPSANPQQLAWDLIIRPTHVNQNLDGLRYALLQGFRVTGGRAADPGSYGAIFTGTSTWVCNLYVPLVSRGYYAASNRDNRQTVNVTRNWGGTGEVNGVNQRICWKIWLRNNYGQSAWNFFYPPVSGADWIQTTMPIVPGDDGGGGGGAPGGGGLCVDVNTKVMLLDNSEKTAADIEVGDLVLVPDGGENNPAAEDYISGQVTHIERSHSDDRLTLTSKAGHSITVTRGHRFFREDTEQPIKVEDCTPGTRLIRQPGGMPVEVESVVPAPPGDVMLITVTGPAVYYSAGILSHNAKPRN